MFWKGLLTGRLSRKANVGKCKHDQEGGDFSISNIKKDNFFFRRSPGVYSRISYYLDWIKEIVDFGEEL